LITFTNKTHGLLQIPTQSNCTNNTYQEKPWMENNKFSSQKPLTIRINIYQLNELGGKSANPGEQ